MKDVVSMEKVLEHRREVKFQKDADVEWAHRIRSLPGCERLYACIQCGTCSSTCPLSIYMDYTPRRIIQLVKEGFREDALKSRTIWLCSSCYSCTARCPQDIKVTDIMYALKREAMKHGLYPKKFPIPVLAKIFYDLVRNSGHNDEFWLMLKLGLYTNPFELLKMSGLGWNLFRTGRLNPFEHHRKVEGLKQLTCLSRSDEEVK
jgi:quinone-modifying oxidoreductase, subunit QmoC